MYEEGLFEVPPGRMKVYVNKNPTTCCSQDVCFSVNKECFCVMLVVICIFFVSDKVLANCFEHEVIPSPKSKYMLKFYQYVALNHLR